MTSNQNICFLPYYKGKTLPAMLSSHINAPAPIKSCIFISAVSSLGQKRLYQRTTGCIRSQPFLSSPSRVTHMEPRPFPLHFYQPIRIHMQVAAPTKGLFLQSWCPYNSLPPAAALVGRNLCSNPARATGCSPTYPGRTLFLPQKQLSGTPCRIIMARNGFRPLCRKAKRKYIGMCACPIQFVMPLYNLFS